APARRPATWPADVGAEHAREPPTMAARAAPDGGALLCRPSAAWAPAGQPAGQTASRLSLAEETLRQAMGRLGSATAAPGSPGPDARSSWPSIS
ncbi:unnamed protein product, partial [Prorocentrum cordatum]